MDHELSNVVTNAFKRPLLKNIRSFEIRSKISKFSSFLIRRVKKNENFEILLPSSELHRILTRSHLKMFGTALQSTLRSIRLIPLDKLSKSLN